MKKEKILLSVLSFLSLVSIFAFATKEPTINYAMTNDDIEQTLTFESYDGEYVDYYHYGDKEVFDIGDLSRVETKIIESHPGGQIEEMLLNKELHGYHSTVFDVTYSWAKAVDSAYSGYLTNTTYNYGATYENIKRTFNGSIYLINYSPDIVKLKTDGEFIYSEFIGAVTDDFQNNIDNFTFTSGYDYDLLKQRPTFSFLVFEDFSLYSHRLNEDGTYTLYSDYANELPFHNINDVISLNEIGTKTLIDGTGAKQVTNKYTYVNPIQASVTSKGNALVFDGSYVTGTHTYKDLKYLSVSDTYAGSVNAFYIDAKYINNIDNLLYTNDRIYNDFDDEIYYDANYDDLTKIEMKEIQILQETSYNNYLEYLRFEFDVSANADLTFSDMKLIVKTTNNKEYELYYNSSNLYGLNTSMVDNQKKMSMILKVNEEIKNKEIESIEIVSCDFYVADSYSKRQILNAEDVTLNNKILDLEDVLKGTHYEILEIVIEKENDDYKKLLMFTSLVLTVATIFATSSAFNARKKSKKEVK